MSSVSSLTYIATNSSAVAASIPRPKPIAYAIASSRFASPASIASRRTRRDVREPVEVAARCDEPERQRQAGLVLPPDAEVEQLVQPGSAKVSWPSWIRSPASARPDDDLVEHLVERQVARADVVAEREPQHAGTPSSAARA